MSAQNPEPPPRQQPWDPGLQVERTTLAWVRTAMSFIAGSMVLLRLIAHHSTVAGVVCALLLLPFSAALAYTAWRRHRRAENSLRAERPLPDGVQHAALAGLSVLVGAAAVVYALVA